MRGHVSITLTVPKAISVNGVQTENDTAGACIAFSVDTFSTTLHAVFKIGTVSGGNIVPGPLGDTVDLAIDYTTGKWVSGGLSGTLGGAGLTAVQNAVKNYRNALESFASGAANIIPGVQVAW